MRRFLAAILISAFAVTGISQRLCAGEVDMLLQKLVEKGILTAGEAQQIGTETREQVRKEIAEGKYSTLPSWVQTMKLKGDFRLRYQYDHAKRLAGQGVGTNTETNRARIRVRLGVEAKPNDKLLVGVGLATGKDDATTIDKDTARSTNQTLGNGFSKHPITLDYAYAQYSATPWATLIGGKFKNPLWEPGDLIWDTDINPEGGAVKLVKNLKLIGDTNTELFLTPALLTIDEGSDKADPMGYMIQGGFTHPLTSFAKVKAGVSYYNFSNVKGKKLDGTTSTNTADPSGNLIYEYQNFVPAIELSFADPLKAIGINLPYLAFFGEYVRNVNSSVKARNTGFMVGMKFGLEKVEKWGDWQVRYNYAMLGKDSILDILPDSDRYGGKTGMRSHEMMVDWGLGKNTWLGFDYYYGWQLPGSFASTQTKPASVFQVDWNMKF